MLKMLTNVVCSYIKVIIFYYQCTLSFLISHRCMHYSCLWAGKSSYVCLPLNMYVKVTCYKTLAEFVSNIFQGIEYRRRCFLFKILKPWNMYSIAPASVSYNLLKWVHVQWPTNIGAFSLSLTQTFRNRYI